ncbi:hypothetical protein PG996_007593 [Apiospora saccharicola]|uniref:Uncharacterized protein n=1 Tax=Apiospora saccharicola TaxID=335842 RepID=A0ABR1VDT1_9PEZI
MDEVTSLPAEDFAFIPYCNDGDKEAVNGVREEEADLLRVRRDAFWSYCGPLLDSTGAASQLPPSLHEWAAAALTAGTGLDLLNRRLLPFLDFLNRFVADNGLDNYWLTIRATMPTAEYDKPRWHTDDMFFGSSNSGDSDESSSTPSPSTSRRWSFWPPPKPKSKSKPREDEEELFSDEQQQQQQELDLETDWKVCTTLLGPSTMFIPALHQPRARKRQFTAKEASRRANEHVCTSIRCVGCASAADDVRRSLDGSLKDLGAVQAGPGQCAFFRIGPGRGAVHSEPRMSSSSVSHYGDRGGRGGELGRIFVNVVPGKREELERLMGKWGMEFPRSWWIAPSRVSTGR